MKTEAEIKEYLNKNRQNYCKEKLRQKEFPLNQMFLKGKISMIDKLFKFIEGEK